MSVAVLTNFTDVNAVTHAAEKVRDAGYTDWDIYTPYAVHGLDKAMGVKRTILPYLSFGGGVAGLISAIGLIWWTSAVDYPMNIGGKPFFAFQYSIPVMFELTILVTALCTVFGMWHLNRIPTWYHPYQDDIGFQRAVNDTFVLAISGNDPRFTLDATTSFVTGLGGDDTRVLNT